MKTDIPRHYAIVNERNEICGCYTTQGKARKDLLPGFRVVRTKKPIPFSCTQAWIDRAPYVADIA